MNENINLCELLKGHERETFYSPIFGDVKVLGIVKFNGQSLIEISYGYYLNSSGRLNNYDGECILFPSKDQRDWNKWMKEPESRIPKTWSEFCKYVEDSDELGCEINIGVNGDDYSITNNGTPIEKSALALLKIHQLREAGYGGNITNEEWDNEDLCKYTIKAYGNNIVPCVIYTVKSHPIAFHTQQQVEEFLSHPENVQLVKDYFMITI